MDLTSVGCATAHPLGVVPEIRADCVQSARIFFDSFLQLILRLFLCFSISTKPDKSFLTGCYKTTQPVKDFLPKLNLIWRRKLLDSPSSQVFFAHCLFSLSTSFFFGSDCFVHLATTAALPEANLLKDRVSELETQLGTATKELERLRSVEIDLSNSSDRLRGELVSLKAAHKEELEKVVAAHAGTEDALRKERDAAVTNLAAAIKKHQEELTAANQKTAAALDGMREMDDMLAGKEPFLF